MTEPMSFRQRLDAVLRTRDVKQVQDFLIAEDQWSADTPEDPELAMWMMIAGSATLKDLHAQAREWLVAHERQEEADAILGRGQKQRSSSGKGAPQKRGSRPQNANSNKKYRK
jgi:hypothetical protein